MVKLFKNRFSLPRYSNPGAGAVRVDGAGGVRNDLGGLGVGGLEGKDVVIRGVGDALTHTDGRLLASRFVLGDKSGGKLNVSGFLYKVLTRPDKELQEI